MSTNPNKYEGASDTPDCITPFVAVRAWRVLPNLRNEDRLWSVYKNGIAWPTRKRLEAKCIQSTASWGPHGIAMLSMLTPKAEEQVRVPHTAPSNLCGCGIYGLNSPLAVEEMLPWNREAFVGITFIWGHVLEGTRGYRGQYARVACLLLDGDEEKRGIIRKMAAIYNVPTIEDLGGELERQRQAQGG